MRNDHQHHSLIWVFAILLPLMMASCVTSRKVNYMQEPDKHIPHYADTLDYTEYVLRPDDRLSIYVYSLDENIMKMYNTGGVGNTNYFQQIEQTTSGRSTLDLYSYLVDDNGDINYPTLGKLHVAGLTTRQTARLMEQQLATLLQEIPGYNTISVEVKVIQRTFSLIGVKSGRYSITKEKMTIFEALAAMGNLQTFSDRSRVKIIRTIDGETTIREFDLRSKDIINSEFYYIQPNDIIYVRELPGKAFGITNASTGLAVVSTTLSFGVFVYTLIQTIINYAK